MRVAFILLVCYGVCVAQNPTGSSSPGQVLYNNNGTVGGAPTTVSTGSTPSIAVDSYTTLPSQPTGALDVPYLSTGETSQRALDLLPSDPSKAPFGFSVDGTLFNSTWDDVFRVGYNCGSQGNDVVQTEPRFCFNIEQDYDRGTVGSPSHVVESYFESGNIGNTLNYRPLFWQFDRQTGAMNRFTLATLRGGGIEFTDAVTDAIWGVFSPTYLQLFGAKNQSQDTQLNLGAQNGHAAAIVLQGGFEIFRVTPDQWMIQGCSNCSLFSRTNGQYAFGQQTYRGSVSIMTPQKRSTLDSTLTMVQAAAQSTPYLIAGTQQASQFSIANTGHAVLGGGSDDQVEALQVNGSVAFNGAVNLGPNSKGSAPASWGANCPAVDCTTPYTWILATAADGSSVYLPVFK